MTPGTGLYVSTDQHRPVADDKIDVRSLGSTPKLIPKFMVSETPIIEIASNTKMKTEIFGLRNIIKELDFM